MGVQTATQGENGGRRGGRRETGRFTWTFTWSSVRSDGKRVTARERERDSETDIRTHRQAERQAGERESGMLTVIDSYCTNGREKDTHVTTPHEKRNAERSMHRHTDGRSVSGLALPAESQRELETRTGTDRKAKTQRQG